MKLYFIGEMSIGNGREDVAVYYLLMKSKNEDQRIERQARGFLISIYINALSALHLFTMLV